MTKRYFTVAEANELVPRLEAAFNRVLRIRAQLRAVSSELEGLGEAMTEEGLAREDGPMSLVLVRARARGLAETLADQLAWIEQIGVEVKDVDAGLCDFVARHDGRDVLLCWRLGEKKVAFWHELSGGFAGRRPIDSAMDRLVH